LDWLLSSRGEAEHGIGIGMVRKGGGWEMGVLNSRRDGNMFGGVCGDAQV
jgi:hypothetical protein